jgi:hypothetical protein
MKTTNISGDDVVAFDFDGVIAAYKGYNPTDLDPKPISDVVNAMRILHEKGLKILVHSTRGDAFLREYCERYGVPFDYINKRPDRNGENPGKPIAFVYVDDRALCYNRGL